MSVKRLLPLVIIPIVISMMLFSCSQTSTRSIPAAETVATSEATSVPTIPISEIPDTPFKMAELPSQGYVDLSSSDEDELEKLGLGGSTPSCEPANLPYNESGLFWSDKLSLNEGDIITVTIYSQSPISWFGVDWTTLDVRGVVAMTDIDEDGWNFVAEYPDNSSTDMTSCTLRLIYQIPESGDYQILIKNSNQSKSYSLKLTALLVHRSTSGQSTKTGDDDD